jgi:hypothetical protein
MTGCSLCRLKNNNMRPQVELLEMMLKDKGHTDWNLSKPLSYNQISYIAYINFGIDIERHALQRHFVKCMGCGYLRSPIYYNRHLKIWIDRTTGSIVPKDQVRNYKRSRSHGTLNQDPPLEPDTKQTQ